MQRLLKLQGVAERTIAAAGRYFVCPDWLEVVQRVPKAWRTTAFNQAVSEMTTLIQLLSAMGLSDQAILRVEFCLAPHAEHYHGFFFQLVARDQVKERVIMTLAAGGRYDQLVQKFRKPSDPFLSVTVVGSEIAMERLFHEQLDQSVRAPPGVARDLLSVAACCKIAAPTEVLLCTIQNKANPKRKLALQELQLKLLSKLYVLLL